MLLPHRGAAVGFSCIPNTRPPADFQTALYGNGAECLITLHTMAHGAPANGPLSSYINARVDKDEQKGSL